MKKGLRRLPPGTLPQFKRNGPRPYEEGIKTQTPSADKPISIRTDPDLMKKGLRRAMVWCVSHAASNGPRPYEEGIKTRCIFR